MIIKVCGVRNAAVARAAVDAGADWIGLVFEPRSPRHVDDAAASEVVAAVDGRADCIGVLIAPTAVQCNALADRYGLAGVQLHGAVDPGIVEQIDVPVIRALNPGSVRAAMTAAWWPDQLLLLDAGAVDGELPGGTGRSVPLDLAGELARHRRIILAGGLRPDSVAEAVAEVRPAGVDASSGLEVAPGVKDAGLVEAYVVAARRAASMAEDAGHG